MPLARDVHGLPPDLAFLAPFGVARDVLRTAAARALVEGGDAHRALLGNGAVSEALYHRALASHLGLPFVDAWPAADDVDPRVALATRRLRLADPGPRWLVAPATSDVRTLVAARALGLTMPDVAITTPGHFAALVCHRGSARIGRFASRALPAAAPLLSAHGALTPPVIAAIVVGLVALLLGLLFGSHIESDALGVVFLTALVFKLAVFAEGAAVASGTPAADLPDRALPAYSVLVPLRQEAEVVADLVASLSALDYPRAKLEVLFLVEPDDPATRAALAALRLPPGFRIIDLPPGVPRTKPRALNVGLLLAHGDFVTIYDAEDRPERDQLRRAAAAFARAPASLACLQARLAISNGASSLLSQLFAIEYASLFDAFNVGLGKLRLPIALGGTSNHFRTAALRAVGGWDAWNVTEDADLGLRLARFGFAVDTLASTTFEEAPERLGLWFKQRRRWTKGWMQTLIVLLRDLPDAVRDLRAKNACVVALLLTNLVTGPLLTPFFLALVGWHLATGAFLAPRGGLAIAETTLAVSVIAVGVVGTLWQGGVGVRRRALSWPALIAFLPYQLLISAAAWCGLVDLVLRPHHWHKTPHGAAARRVRRRASAAEPPA